jgi:hypothetical protein
VGIDYEYFHCFTISAIAILTAVSAESTGGISKPSRIAVRLAIRLTVGTVFVPFFAAPGS